MYVYILNPCKNEWMTILHNPQKHGKKTTNGLAIDFLPELDP